MTVAFLSRKTTMSLSLGAHAAQIPAQFDADYQEMSMRTMPIRTSTTLLRTLVDWFGALVLLILSIPVLLAAIVLIKLTSAGPVLYRQTRLGRGGHPYSLFKLRTMVHDSEKNGAC